MSTASRPPHDAIKLDGRVLVNELGSKSLIRASGEHGKDRTALIGGLEGTIGMVGGAKGDVYVTEAFAGLVSLIGSNGEKTVVAKDLKMPDGIARAADGRLIVAVVGAKRIIEINPQSGTVTEIATNRPRGGTRRAADQHSNRHRHRIVRGDLLLVGCGERDLQGGEEVASGTNSAS